MNYENFSQHFPPIPDPVCLMRQPESKRQQGNGSPGRHRKKFTLPLIPAMLNTPELRADYLVRHYWDNMDFTDTTYINLPNVTEQAWVDFIDILKIVPDTTAIAAIKQMYKMADQKKVVFFYYTDLAEKYLYDPNSPMRNEEFYIPVLDAMLESKVLNDTEKILPQGRRELAEQNRIGRPAEDFTYTLLSGKTVRSTE